MDTLVNKAQRETRSLVENYFNDQKVRRSPNGNGTPTYKNIVDTIQHIADSAYEKALRITESEYLECGFNESVVKAGGSLETSGEGYERVLIIEDIVETFKVGHDARGKDYFVDIPLVAAVQCRKTATWRLDYTKAFDFARYIVEDGTIPNNGASTLGFQSYTKGNGKTEARNGNKQKGHAIRVADREYESIGKLSLDNEVSVETKLNAELNMSANNGTTKTVDLGHFVTGFPVPPTPNLTISIGDQGTIKFGNGFVKNGIGVGVYEIVGTKLEESYKSRLVRLHADDTQSPDQLLITLEGQPEQCGFNGNFDAKRDITDTYKNNYLVISTNCTVGKSAKSRQTFKNLGMEDQTNQDDYDQYEKSYTYDCELVDVGETMGILVDLTQHMA